MTEELPLTTAGFANNYSGSFIREKELMKLVKPQDRPQGQTETQTAPLFQKDADKVKELKEKINERLKGLRLVRDSVKVRQIEAKAKEAIARSTVGTVYTWKTYQNKIGYYSRLSAKEVVKGDYNLAIDMKEKELYHAYLAKHAVIKETEVEKDKRRLKAILKNITKKDKPAIMNTQARYFIRHLMYQLDLAQTDVPQPLDGFDINAIEKLLNVDAEFNSTSE